MCLFDDLPAFKMSQTHTPIYLAETLCRHSFVHFTDVEVCLKFLFSLIGLLLILFFPLQRCCVHQEHWRRSCPRSREPMCLQGDTSTFFLFHILLFVHSLSLPTAILSFSFRIFTVRLCCSMLVTSLKLPLTSFDSKYFLSLSNVPRRTF